MDSPESSQQNSSDKNKNPEVKINNFMNPMTQNNMMIDNQEGMMNLMMAQQNMMNQMMMNNPQNMMAQQNMMNQMMMNNPQIMMMMAQQNMMNQMTMMNQQNINDQFIKNQNFLFGQNNENDINNMTVIFKVPYFYDLPGRTITVLCNINDKVSYIIKKYRMKLGRNEEYHEKFIYNAKKIKEDLTLGEIGLMNNSMIFVLNTRDIQGGK